jgi:ribosome-binding factor A
MVNKSRAVRIAERIREEISALLQKEVQDPRLAGITITDVTVDRELAFADVYFSVLEGEKRSVEVLAGLEHAQGFFRSELARQIRLHHFPRLRFHWDPSIERSERINYLLNQIQKEDQQHKDSETTNAQ